MSRWSLLWVGGALLAAPFLAAHADTARPARENAATWQRATPEDIHVFDPYIGRFQSKTFHDDSTGRAYHFVVEYRWFDAAQRIVRFSVKTVVPDEGREIEGGVGFYGYDPFHERLYASAFFPNGTTGFGGVSEFDRRTHARVTLARSQNPDGAFIEVRDAFEVIDADTWKNTTSVSRDGGEWKVVYEDTFRRLGGDS